MWRIFKCQRGALFGTENREECNEDVTVLVYMMGPGCVVLYGLLSVLTMVDLDFRYPR